VWVQDRRTPWAGPLLVAGGALAILGGILYLLAVDHDRRGLGPRRGRRGPFQGLRNLVRRGGTAGGSGTRAGRGMKSIIAVPILGLTLALGLSGCSASYWPSMSPKPSASTPTDEAESNVAPIPITQSQIDRIIHDIVRVADEADEELDAKIL